MVNNIGKPTGQAFVDTARELVEMQAAFHDYFYFHENFDIREGHRKRCNRWKGLECTCDGEKIRAAAVKYAVTQSDAGVAER